MVNRLTDVSQHGSNMSTLYSVYNTVHATQRAFFDFFSLTALLVLLHNNICSDWEKRQ